MPIPTTRRELVGPLRKAFARLDRELDALDADAAERICIDDWTVHDLLVVRRWWTAAVVDWIEAWRRGEQPETPRAGYRWRETPRLNADLIAEQGDAPLVELVASLRAGSDRALSLIDVLDDRELLEPGVFAPAGKWPVARWLSINTTRQYETAARYLRRARLAAGDA